jgi:hypothetical protein
MDGMRKLGIEQLRFKYTVIGRTGWLLCLVLIAYAMTGYAADSQNALSVGDAPDYSRATTWICRPGADDVCTADQDAVIVYADGHRMPQPFAAAKDPAIDCFYVYPTVSEEPTEYSDLAASPEIKKVVNSQAGRLASRCRVFAPLYRQATLAHLRHRQTGASGTESDMPMRDVEAAWTYYLTHDNQGRGVVLIGHSQGTILLQKLIASQIDGRAPQRLLVSAFLAGDPSLGVPHGKHLGGTFQHIPTCSSIAQTGCVYVWGSYFADDTSAQIFGMRRSDSLDSACVSPAAPGGGKGVLKLYHRKAPFASADDPPWVETVGQLSGECRASESGVALRVAVEPGPVSGYLTGLLERPQLPKGWGLHVRDIALVQGNILEVLDAEIGALPQMLRGK